MTTAIFAGGPHHGRTHKFSRGGATADMPPLRAADVPAPPDDADGYSPWWIERAGWWSLLYLHDNLNLWSADQAVLAESAALDAVGRSCPLVVLHSGPGGWPLPPILEGAAVRRPAHGSATLEARLNRGPLTLQPVWRDVGDRLAQVALTGAPVGAVPA